jgi:uncharacterized Zn-finger protein
MTVLQPPEIVEVESKLVACDGEGRLGHPRVYLNMGDKNAIDCPYCGRQYRLRPGVKSTGHGH